jgi:hypothetical protein
VISCNSLLPPLLEVQFPSALCFQTLLIYILPQGEGQCLTIIQATGWAVCEFCSSGQRDEDRETGAWISPQREIWTSRDRCQASHLQPCTSELGPAEGHRQIIRSSAIIESNVSSLEGTDATANLVQLHSSFVTKHGVFRKRASPWYSKCYFVASVTKTFILKGVQTIHHSRCSRGRKIEAHTI